LHNSENPFICEKTRGISRERMRMMAISILNATLSSARMSEKNKPAVAAVTRAESARDRAGKRNRKRPVDGRTRPAKAWRRHYEHYAALAGKQHDQLARALATLITQRDFLDQASARGEMIDPLLACRLSGEIRRLLTRLGLDEPEPYDGTADAINALRAGRDEARPA
jgi:hypothetical protein